MRHRYKTTPLSLRGRSTLKFRFRATPREYDGIINKSYRPFTNALSDLKYLQLHHYRVKDSPVILNDIKLSKITSNHYSITNRAECTIKEGEFTTMNNIIKKEKDTLIKPLHGISRVVANFEDSLIDAEMKHLRSKFGIEMLITNSAEIEIITNWIRKHDPRFESHIMNPYSISETNKRRFILSGIFFVKLAPYTFLYVDAESHRLLGTREDRPDYSPIYIYLFGRLSFKIFRKLAKYINAKNTSTNKIYSIVGVENGDQTYWNCTASKLTPRTMNTIFIDPDQKKRITDHIDQWVKNEEMYTNRGLLFKTGILLYGKAGTGKSSMAMAIANYLGCGLITIDPTTFEHMNIPEITESIVADETKYVILIDEIDTIFKSRDDAEATDTQKLRTAKLLAFLDSPQSPTNVIFVATTNYIERIDVALKRKGRFDIVEEMGDIDEPVAMEMCRSFGLSNDEIQIVIDKYAEATNKYITNTVSVKQYNPANLQDAILVYLKEKEMRTSDIVIDIDEPETSEPEPGTEQEETEPSERTTDIIESKLETLAAEEDDCLVLPLSDEVVEYMAQYEEAKAEKNVTEMVRIKGLIKEAKEKASND